MANYTESKDGLDNIAGRITAHEKSYNNIGGNIDNRISDLTNIPTDHEDVLDTLNAYSGSDPAWLNLKAELSNMTTDFVDLRSRYTALKAAYEAI